MNQKFKSWTKKLPKVIVSNSLTFELFESHFSNDVENIVTFFATYKENKKEIFGNLSWQEGDYFLELSPGDGSNVQFEKVKELQDVFDELTT